MWPAAFVMVVCTAALAILCAKVRRAEIAK
jgi:hypothetical protein